MVLKSELLHLFLEKCSISYYWIGKKKQTWNDQLCKEIKWLIMSFYWVNAAFSFEKGTLRKSPPRSFQVNCQFGNWPEIFKEVSTYICCVYPRLMCRQTKLGRRKTLQKNKIGWPTYSAIKDLNDNLWCQCDDCETPWRLHPRAVNLLTITKQPDLHRYAMPLLPTGCSRRHSCCQTTSFL